ncbi:hypothetical protein, partial [Faecalibacterium duncaniae]|uniref:hypothetical protein n=1 Tax=Faecalibacterium duncaniae (strain DSM 17677 / JCM 31915 / A2-165) TaxID=411483 RepID=UPI00294150DB
RLLGQDDREGTGRVSSFCFYVALITGVVLAVLMMLFRVPLLGWVTNFLHEFTSFLLFHCAMCHKQMQAKPL